MTLAPAVALTSCTLVFDSGRHTAASVDASQDANRRADGSLDDAHGTVPVEHICAEIAAIGCDAVRDCCPSVPAPDAWDATPCVAALEAQCADAFDLVGERTALDYDEAAAWEVVQAAARFAEACDVAILDWYLDREGLLAPIVGTIPAGGDCTPRDARNEDDLAVAALSCAGDNRCIRTSFSGRWICGAPAALGDECTLAFDCASGSRCTREALAPGTCRAMGEPAGSACTRSDECDSLLCDGPLLRKTCAPRSVDHVFCPATLFDER